MRQSRVVSTLCRSCRYAWRQDTAGTVSEPISADRIQLKRRNDASVGSKGSPSFLPFPRGISRRDFVLSASGALLAACDARRSKSPASITFSRVPRADDGDRGQNDIIEGKVAGLRPGQRIVLYAKSGSWWLQPIASEPFTEIQANLSWINATHLGTDYAALLVDAGYVPQQSMDRLPAVGGMVSAVESVKGQARSPSVITSFSGYEWRVRNVPSNRGNTPNLYDPANVWVDADGAMHLRTLKKSSKWTCAEVSLTRSLGFGTYLFSVRDISQLDPATVFGMFTWDYAGVGPNNREMDIEISRWGDRNSKNAQYVIQPSHIPANVFRFATPAGSVTHSFVWKPGRLSCKSVQANGSSISQYDFTSGVPSPGLESVRMVLYAFGGGKVLPGKEDEVIVEKFEYLP